MRFAIVGATALGCSGIVELEPISPPAPPPDGDATPTEIDPEWPSDTPLPSEFDFPPYLNLLDRTTIVVSWRTDAATTGMVRFGTTQALGNERPSGPAANLHHVTLSDLVPGSAYYYEVAIDQTVAIRKGVFVMPGRTKWRFVHVGEFHAPGESSNVPKFAAAIREFRPHVIVESGDMVDTGEDFGHWQSYFQLSSPWISNVIHLPAHSNHVNGTGGNANLLDYFVLPNNERWYVTRYGQVEFFTIDSAYDFNEDVTSVELAWISAQNQLAHDQTDDPSFVIGAWHYPACSSHYPNRLPVREWVHNNLIEKFRASGGIDLVLVAHDKYYERSLIGDIPHVMTNLGTNSPGAPNGNHPACTPVKTLPLTRSTALLSVDGDTISARVIDETHVEIDSFTITK